jgi:hypothetical protein
MIPTKMRKWIVTVLAPAALILTFSLTATAATYDLELNNTLWLTNDYQVDTLYLYISDGPVTFDSLASAPGDWSLASPVTSDRMIISGTAIDPGTGTIQINLLDRLDGFLFWGTYEPFTLEWAEYYQGQSQGEGSILFGDGWATATPSDIVTNPVPIPAAAWLFTPGLLFLVARRHAMRS